MAAPSDPTDPAALRIAYFITSYGTGEQLLRLVRTIRRAEPDSPIVVHHDEFGKAPLDRAPFDAAGVHVLAGSEAVAWGDMSLEAARWRVFRWIRDHLDVDWIMLLSEQDYPVAPFERLRERLAASGADAILSAQRVEDMTDPVARRDARDRYYYRYRFLPAARVQDRVPTALAPVVRAGGRLLQGLLRHSVVLDFYRGVPELGMRDRIGVRARRRVFPPGFPCWVNECWFPLSMRAANAVLDHVDAHPDFVDHYARTVIPLESATATVLCNHPDLTIEPGLVHAIRWSDPTSGRPDVFRLRDLDELRASGACFARKFDPRDTALLDALDEIVFARRVEVG
jgi:hypothetical protein